MLQKKLLESKSFSEQSCQDMSNTTGCLTISVKSVLSEKCWCSTLSFHMVNGDSAGFEFFWCKKVIFFGQVQVQLVLCGYSTFWPVNHFTWYIWPKQFISGVRFDVWRHSGWGSGWGWGTGLPCIPISPSSPRVFNFWPWKPLHNVPGPDLDQKLF